ncbi:hypothetical protein [Nonomuraea soli]|uniref:Uncharacterized protein n=1 Tax=Nonomuraea soli TaxID=1032476 RepID=A0A7W0CP52_9ACTN|nr:hypothetical protein [Nonomuraea soli]MBA2894756.1 hypothetical protein [Nonomuraea soli]
MSRWQMLKIILRVKPSVLLPGWMVRSTGLMVIVPVGAAGLLVVGPLRWMLMGLMGLAALALLWNAGRAGYRWRNPVLIPAEHPELAALVSEAAGLAGVAVVREMRLSGVAVMSARKGRVILGMPLLIGLSRDDLRTLLTMEFVYRRSGWLDACLTHAWLTTTDEQAAHAVQRLRRGHWEAAGKIVGGDRLGVALRRRWQVEAAFLWCMARFVYQGTYPADLFKLFRWKVEHDRLLDRVEPPPPSPAARGLARELGWPDGPITSTPGPTVFFRLAEKVEDRLCRAAAHWAQDEDLKGAPPSHAFRVDDGPVDSSGIAALVTQAATELIGAEATPQDVVDLVAAGRGGELDWRYGHMSCPHPTPGVCALVPLLEQSLRKRGYTSPHPYKLRELVGPAGDTIDLHELAAKIENGLPYEL